MMIQIGIRLRVLLRYESIKVFLGLEGFIYIVVISHETISKLVLFHKDSDKGEHYLRRVIQIPITIPDWNDVEAIQDLVSRTWQQNWNINAQKS
jgi:KAP family P-loop domain